MEAARLAAGDERRAGFGARRQLGRAGGFARQEDQGRRRHARRRDGRGRGHPGDARFGPRPDDDPRLPHARPLPCQARPARPDAPARSERPGPRLLWLHRGRLRPPDLPRPRPRAGIRDHPRDARHPPAHLLLDARRRVHAHLGRCREELDPGAHRRAGQGHRLHAGRQEGDPQQADRGGRLRALHRRQVHRHQALRPRRRRVGHPGAGADHQARRQSRRPRDRARHGPSRPPEHPRPGHGQAAPRHLPRVQGRLVVARRRRRLRRREVPPRRLVGSRVRQQQGPPVADRQPVASGDRRSGGARQGARQAGPACRQAARRHHSA